MLRQVGLFGPARQDIAFVDVGVAVVNEHGPGIVGIRGGLETFVNMAVVGLGRSAGNTDDCNHGGRCDDVTNSHDTFSKLGFIRESPDLMRENVMFMLYLVT